MINAERIQAEVAKVGGSLAAWNSATIFMALSTAAKQLVVDEVNAELPRLFPGINITVYLSNDGRIKVVAKP